MVNIIYYPDVNEIEGLAPDLTVILANNSSGTSTLIILFCSIKCFIAVTRGDP